MTMTKDEIVSYYNAAADKAKAIEQLANINCTSLAAILEALVPGKVPVAPRPDAVPHGTAASYEIYDRIETILAALPDHMMETVRQNAGSLIMGLFAAYLATRLGEDVFDLDTFPRQSSEKKREKLTEEKQIGPFGSLKDKAEAVPGAFGTYDCFYAHMVAVTRLKQYEDTGLTPEEITALIAPNDPLTLEELREMDGKPVWCAFSEGRDCNMIIQWHNSEFFKSFECGFLLVEEYGKSWQAYRRKPEET